MFYLVFFSVQTFCACKFFFYKLNQVSFDTDNQQINAPLEEDTLGEIDFLIMLLLLHF